MVESLIDGGAILGGGAVGVITDKIVGDLLLAWNINNPEYMHLQLHDVLLVAGELLGAAYTPPPINSFLVGMAGAVIVTDVFQNVSESQWFKPTFKTQKYVQKGFMHRLS
jgi:hypothetical protein